MSITTVSVSTVAGGAEAHTVALARGMRARGHGVVLYGECPGWDENDLPRHAIGLGPKWSRRNLPAALLRISVERRRIRSIPASSLAYLQFKREQITLTRTLARTAPVVWTEHGRWMGGRVGRLLLAAYARAASHASRVVCVSDDVAGDLRNVVDPNKLVVVPNAVDTRRYAPVSDELRQALRERLLPRRFRHRLVAVVVARLHRDKRLHRAIVAVRMSGGALVILGDGPDRHRLAELSGDDVAFAGHRDDVQDYLAAGDFFVYCGAETDCGNPIVVLEAAASGLPIVAFRGDGGSDFVPRCGGLVIDDPAELTPDLAAALDARRGAGVEHVARYHGWDRWLDGYERVFREVAQ